MKLVKKSEYQLPKRAFYNAITWAEATLQFDAWKEILESENKAKMFVHDNFYFVSSIWEKNNMRYSGIHRMNERGEIIHGSGVNLDNYEWKALMLCKDDINDALFGRQEIRGVKKGRDEVEVWTLKWFKNGEEVDTEAVQELKKIKFFSKDFAEWYGKAEENDPKIKGGKKDTIEMKVESGFSLRPDPMVQMQMVLYYFASEITKKMCAMDCQACRTKPAGQIHHMKVRGCLKPDVDFGGRYIHQVLPLINPEYLVYVYNTVCKYLKVPPHSSEMLAKAALKWIPAEAIAKAVTEGDLKYEERSEVEGYMNEVLDDTACPLYNLVMDAYSDGEFDDTIEAKIRAEYPQNRVFTDK